MAIGAKAIEKHMAAAIVPHYPGANSVVACAMKHSRTMFLNQISPDTNWVETGAGARDKLLRQEYEEKRDGPHDWLSIFKSIDVPAMCLLNLANLYYSLPAPDACLYKLITAVERNMSQENYVDPVVRKDFEAFVKAVSVARACYRSGDRPNMIIHPEYMEEVELFMEAAKRKGMTMAHHSIWGKVKLRQHNPFIPRADMEHLNLETSFALYLASTALLPLYLRDVMLQSPATSF